MTPNIVIKAHHQAQMAKILVIVITCYMEQTLALQNWEAFKQNATDKIKKPHQEVHRVILELFVSDAKFIQNKEEGRFSIIYMKLTASI